MTDQEKLAELLFDFAQLICPDPRDARLMAAVKNKANEIAAQVGEVAYGEAAETVNNYVNPTALV